jgi:LacI family transcriptional regulator
MRVTIKEVAKQAKVSAATVSLVLNNAPGISTTTREHVLQVMKDLNYRPDSLARSFSTRRAQSVGLVMPPWRGSFDDPYFTRLMRGVLESVRDQDYHLVLEVADSRFVEQRLWNDLFITRRVDGFLVAAPTLDQEYLVDLARHDIPALLINGARPDLPALNYVGYDDFRCGIDATYYLIGLGHRRIAHLAGPQNEASAVLRLDGFREALTRSRIAVDECDVLVTDDYRGDSAVKSMQALLKRPARSRPTAIFSANDTMAIAAMEVILASGYRIPEDFSIIGVDDTGAAAVATPALTTLRQEVFELARLATQRFLARLDNRTSDSGPLAERLQMTLVERASCAPPRTM